MNDEKFFVLKKNINFCPDFFGYVGKGTNKKAKVNFKIYDVANWETIIIIIYILPDIWRSKANLTMKFGQLVEYNMKNIFL